MMSELLFHNADDVPLSGRPLLITDADEVIFLFVDEQRLLGALRGKADDAAATKGLAAAGGVAGRAVAGRTEY